MNLAEYLDNAKFYITDKEEKINNNIHPILYRKDERITPEKSYTYIPIIDAVSFYIDIGRLDSAYLILSTCKYGTSFHIYNPLLNNFKVNFKIDDVYMNYTIRKNSNEHFSDLLVNLIYIPITFNTLPFINRDFTVGIKMFSVYFRATVMFPYKTVDFKYLKNILEN